MKKSALQPLELITEQNNAAFGLKIGGENMTNRIEVTPEQLASLLLINIAITDLLEQGAHADILEELEMLQPDLQNIVAQI